MQGYYDTNLNQEYLAQGAVRELANKNDSHNLTVDELIDWIRSFQYQDCQNVMVLNDLQNGVVFCQLVHDIIYYRQKPDFIARVIRQNTSSSSLINMTTALNAIKDSSFDVPSKIISMQPQQLCEENEFKLRVLQYLYTLQQRKSESSLFHQQFFTEQNQENQFKSQNLNQITNHNYQNSRNVLSQNNSSQKLFTPRTIADDNQHIQVNQMIQKFQNSPNLNAGSLFFNNKQKQSAEISKISSIQNNYQDNSNYNSLSSRITENIQHQPTNQNQLFIPLNQSLRSNQGVTSTPNLKASQNNSVRPTNSKTSISSLKKQNNPDNQSGEKLAFQQQQVQQSVRLNTVNSPVSPITQISNIKHYNMSIDQSSISTPNHMISLFATQTNSTPDLKGQGRVFHHQKVNSQISKFNANNDQIQNSNRMIPSSISHRESSLSKIPPSILQSQTNTSTISKKRKNVTLDLRDQQDQIQTIKSINNDLIGNNQNNSCQKSASNLSPQQNLNPKQSSQKSSQWWKDVHYIEQQNGETIQVIPVNNETKARLYRWLVDITLIKDDFDSKNVDRLAKFGKNGALFADLLNRITGKTNPLFNGIFRGAKNSSQVNVNFNKAFSFMRQQQKLNPRYLWCIDFLKDGNPNIFWGLIDDLWHWSHQKISPYDSRFKQNQQRLTAEQQQLEKSFTQRENKEFSYDKICFNQEAQKQKKLEESYSMHKANKLSQSQQNLQLSMQPSHYQSILSTSKQNIGGNQSTMNHSISMRQFTSSNNNTQQNYHQQINQNQSYQKRQGSPMQNNYILDTNLKDQSNLTLPTAYQNQSFSKALKRKSPLRTPMVQMPTNSYKEQSDYRKLIVETTNNFIHSSQSPTSNKNNNMYSPKHPSNQATARFRTEQINNSNTKRNSNFMISQGNQTPNQTNVNNLGQSTEFYVTDEKFYNLQQDLLNKSNQLQSSNRVLSPSYHSPRLESKRKSIGQMISPSSQNITQTLSRMGSSNKSLFGKSKNYVDTLRQEETRNIFSPVRQIQSATSKGGNIIDKNLEKICKHWLLEIDYQERELNFFTKDDQRFIFQDEARNGLFLQSLLFKVGMWNIPFDRKGIIRKPQSIEECRYNLSLIFEILHENKVEIHQQYQNYELLLQGSINSFWNIIYSIKKHLQGEESDSYEQNLFKILPYSQQEISQLESSLNQWLSNEIFQTKVENIFTQFYQKLCNGLFWVDLVETVTKRKVKNVNYHPKDQAHSFNNISNALAPLKTFKNFGQGFTYKEEQLVVVNKQVVLGLLEDFRRYFDGQPARQEPNYFKDGPYLGFRKMTTSSNNYKIQALEEDLDSNRQITANSPYNYTSSRNNISTQNQDKSIINATSPQSKLLNQSKSSKMVSSKEIDPENAKQIISDRQNVFPTPRNYRQGSFGEQIVSQGDLQSSFRRRPSNLSNFGIDQSKQQLNQSNLPQAEKSTIQQNLSPQSQKNQNDQDDNFQMLSSNNKMNSLFKKFVSPIKYNQNNKINYDNSFDTIQKMNSYLPESRNDQKSLNESYTRSAELSYLREMQSPKKISLNQTYLSSNIYQSSESEIFQWLCLLGFEDFVTKVDFDQPYIEEIKDGIFIAKLVEVLEGKEIKGLILEPKKKSCCIQNIRKAFNLIRNKRDVDFALVEHEEKIYEAERNYMFTLFNNLKYAYRQKTQYYHNFNKSQSRSLLNHNMTMSSPQRAEQLFYSKKEKENYILNKTEWEKSIVRPIKAQI
ncbi:hypothetical protein TTHERM_00188990 (macronuclear) [Tetrahymena thermophila SB210]|uniref:Calponin-homology (CH) domain-containing protein n=1 Tax=Tetrahymena thermophila (strain SB210) TaxID=312017 RepID=I7MJG8_TETTS|nr:hypothetical protein TTHERM_00188990 [Tetrahymena thermophila SB210]EAR96330.2 hypothetical protein TTHERM_00188990 [Tetrahymena thermophila SB210]|eukprot:XP_001016575.2 hypothetical protein TTHERM_00188990 [Tetrahymena thermophila SB210]